MKGLLRAGGLNRWSERPRGPAGQERGVSGRRSRPGRTAEISRAGDEGVGRDVPGSGVPGGDVPGGDVPGGEAHRAHAGTGAVAGAVTDGALTDSHGLHAVIVTA